MRILRWCQLTFSKMDSASRFTVLGALLVLLVFLASTAMRQPLPAHARDLPPIPAVETQFPLQPFATLTPTFTPTPAATPTRTPIPAYLLDNADDTDGIIIGTMLLVVIVLIGTTAGIYIRRNQHPN
jgi:hypothetical protein